MSYSPCDLAPEMLEHPAGTPGLSPSLGPATRSSVGATRPGQVGGRDPRAGTGRVRRTAVRSLRARVRCSPGRQAGDTTYRICWRGFLPRNWAPRLRKPTSWIWAAARACSVRRPSPGAIRSWVSTSHAECWPPPQPRAQQKLPLCLVCGSAEKAGGRSEHAKNACHRDQRTGDPGVPT